MSLACPKCGSRFLRESEPRSRKEKLDRLRFISPLRCLDCKTRFVARTISVSNLRYARCPKCHRMDLNGWTGKTYTPPFFMGLKVNLGAKKWRCEYCRLNFASFRPRKEIFTFKRWKNLQDLAAAAEKENSTK
jgi:DNA-directed RNA polymerase subunit RPC12/RpoP